MSTNTTINILGVNATVGSVETVHETVRTWINRDERHYMTLTGAHGVMECQRDWVLLGVHNRAGMVAMDGGPLVRMARLRGASKAVRVDGPSLLRHALHRSRDGSIRHFFYGADDDTLQALAPLLESDFPGAKIAGTHAPLVEGARAREEDTVVQAIKSAKPHIVWVDLETPRQEYWMANHLARLNANVLIGVGGSFKTMVAAARPVPGLIRRVGLEGAYRAMRDPRPQPDGQDSMGFLTLSAMEMAGLRKSQEAEHIVAS